MRSNFEFLKDKFPEFYKKVNDAEKALQINPTMCVAWCRNSLESGLKYIAKLENVSLYRDDYSLRNKDLIELIKDKEMDLTEEIKDYAHKLRSMGNKAVHGKVEFTNNDAFLALKLIHILFVYIYENYIYYNELEEIPNYNEKYY